MEQNIGSLETLGEVIGVKEETSDSLEERTILTLKDTAHGLFPLILGVKISETKQSQKLKMLNLNSS